MVKVASVIAPTKSTGGGGFVFEGKVCAWFLAHMLENEEPFPETGSINKVQWQARVDGWLLDDLLITTSVNDKQHRYAVEIKSNNPFRTAGLL